MKQLLIRFSDTDFQRTFKSIANILVDAEYVPTSKNKLLDVIHGLAHPCYVLQQSRHGESEDSIKHSVEYIKSLVTLKSLVVDDNIMKDYSDTMCNGDNGENIYINFETKQITEL